jgi:UTP--glucose-1-phosphate uridylyltransferase
MKKVTKLVLPIAGLGKRLLPLTKHIPKNLVPVNGKPLIEYVLEEAVVSGIREIVLIVNPKHERQFASYLKKNAKKFPTLKFHIRIQRTPGGNGHAIAQAYDIIKNEPFAVRFCDDILLGNPTVLKGLLDIFYHYHSSVILLERVPKNMVSRFGVVGFEKKRTPKFFGGKVYQLNKIVEKPAVKDAPSNLTIVGGYVFTPTILKNLKLVADTLPVVADDALPVAVALQIELIVHSKVYGWEFPGRRLDCGTLLKLQEAEEFLSGSGKNR